MSGLTGEYVRVAVPGGGPFENEIKKVKILQTHTKGCKGELVDTSLQSERRELIPQCEVTPCG
jgi:hypothetical protein